MREKLIGDRRFYRRLFAIAVPMMIQMAITNFASMLDNVMVGQMGTEQMTGVAIANQLVFVYNLFIFGAVSGPGIYTAQFFGQRNEEGIRYTMRFKLLLCGALTLIGLILMGSMGEQLIQLYLHTENGTTNAALTLQHGLDYLHIVMISFIPSDESRNPFCRRELLHQLRVDLRKIRNAGSGSQRSSHRNRGSKNCGDGYRRRLGAYEEGQKSLCQRTVPLNENTGRSGKRNCHQGNAALGQ